MILTLGIQVETVSIIGVPIVNKSQAGRFALELSENQGQVELRFGVHVNGSYRYHAYNIENAVSGPINGADSYFLTGAYDGMAEYISLLMVDENRRAATYREAPLPAL